MTDAYEGLGEFEWDPGKARVNFGKHRVTFEEASTAFRDPFSLTVPDLDHSETEDRLVLIGQSDRRRLLVVSYVERGETLRLISARVADPNEKKEYEEEPEMRSRYSFKGGQRGRYAHLFPAKPHLVVLSPDMAAVFPDSDAVNEALRTLVKAVQGAAVLPEREAA